MPEDRRPNRLINEKSPYLLEHAYNPVDWYPWGDEAFQKARQEQKPIFLSVGYSSCHWCHRLREESFENPETASFLNEKFVSIKVDREERPNVDEVYMKAVISLTGQGGWPLSVFLTPDLKPFYGGTYFPPRPSQGLPSFMQLLEFIAKRWSEKRSDVEHDAEQIIEAVREAYRVERSGTLNKGIIDGGYAALVSAFDAEYGGYGESPKFPLPTYLSFLMRYFKRTRKELALKSVAKTLQAIRCGGIHDHLGGGFHRYSTDRYWLVPHFEKMLYDNALLARAYCEAYQTNGDEIFSRTARETLGWMLNEMLDPEGGFHSAQDADTPDGEGFYYTWSRNEILSNLRNQDGEVFCYVYGVSSDGNFEEGRSVLHLARSSESAALKFGMKVDEVESLLARSRKALLDARSRRKRPAVDDKVLTGWNGLAISAFASAYQAMQEDHLLAVAKRCADFVLRRMLKGDTLYRRYRDGEVAIAATLEDYSFLVAALTDLYEADLARRWLDSATDLARRMMDLFWDEEGGFILDNSADSPHVKVKESYDGPIPSGNSAAVLALLRLSKLVGDEEFRTRAEKTLNLFSGVIDSDPSAHTAMLSALDFYYGPTREIVVAADALNDEASKMLREVQTRFIPAKVLCLIVNGDPEKTITTPLTTGKVALGGRPTVYICENFACKTPISDLSVLRRELER